MCGYVGKFSINNFYSEDVYEANRFNVCRGPDDLQTLEGNQNKINYSLVFNRLSILDLTNKAAQPMQDSYGNIIMFNGEIYNHRELRKYLESRNVKFTSNHSDTEVLLHGLKLLGTKFLKMAIGQFSIMYLNRNENTLTLIRDRVGQKPLFYYKNSQDLLISTNLKTILKLKKDFDIRDDSLMEYFDTGVISAPNTLFKEVYKLQPGEVVTFSIEENFRYKKYKFWSIDNATLTNKKPFIQEEFKELLIDSIKIRQYADVKVANLLSGGIDSTTILKIAKENTSSNSLNTFSITNKGTQFDETKWINDVIEKYDVSYQKVDIDVNNIHLDLIDESIEAFDEPYSDPSTVPSYIIYKEISKHYKVAISGDGGDELLGGYTRILKTLNRSKNKHSYLNFYPAFLGSGNKLSINQQNLDNAYLSFFKDPKFLKLLNLKSSNLDEKFINFEESEYMSMINFDYRYYLPEMMMLKVDRASMANSVEIRSPFVDHRLIEYMLASNFEVTNYEDQKKPLKKILSEDFTDTFINRKKMGFVFDLKKWIYGNSHYLSDFFNKESIIVGNLNPEIMKTLSINKSNMNAQRIWRIYFIEKYLNSLKNL
jgi:asparagine synthase (glutamine-hydrolysing)